MRFVGSQRRQLIVVKWCATCWTGPGPSWILVWMLFKPSDLFCQTVRMHALSHKPSNHHFTGFNEECTSQIGYLPIGVKVDYEIKRKNSHEVILCCWDKSKTNASRKKHSSQGSKLLALPRWHGHNKSTRFPQDIMRCLHDHGWHPGFWDLLAVLMDGYGEKWYLGDVKEATITIHTEAPQTGLSQRIPCAQRGVWQQQRPSSSAKRKYTGKKTQKNISIW